MCCFFTILVFLGPRIAGPIWWIVQPVRWQSAFSDFLTGGNLWWIWPVLGIIFLPWTTIMYVIVAPGGVEGWDWLWLGLMLALARSDAGVRYSVVHGWRRPQTCSRL
jgi:hypothetical protein